MSRLPWKDLTPAFAALIALGVAWGVARGVLDQDAGTVVNAAAGAIFAIVVAWTAWLGSRHAKNQTSGVKLEGELRSALIDRVRSRWIGTRDDSGRLIGEGKLAQDLALGNELKIFLERSTAIGTTSPVSLIEAWRSAGHGMVLTGTPGAGKSVQLLLLAEMLLNAAEHTPGGGVPVILNLAAWRPSGSRNSSTEANDRPFEEWLLAEVQGKFRIPKESSRTWLVQGALIPILDGLDEVLADDRQILFQQMVKWVRDKEMPPAAWALGCREQEYAELDPNYDLIGSRSTFWSVKAISDEDWIGFLKYAERMNAAWHPVVDALERGEARHLTKIDERGRGVFATPLGLTIAVEAYQRNDIADSPTPSELLNPAGDWTRLWTRYVSHRYLLAHSDPDDDADEIKQRYTFDDARRWLATLASERIFVGGEIDDSHIQPPNRPAAWVNFWSFVKSEDRLQGTLLSLWFTWSLVFGAFGALISWRGWGGVVGFVLALFLAATCGLMLRIRGFPAFPEHTGDMRRGWYRYFPLATLAGLPGLLVIATGLSWPGALSSHLFSLPRAVLAQLSRWLFDSDFFFGGREEFTTDAAGGFMTGWAVAVMTAGLPFLVYMGAKLVHFVTKYRRRRALNRPSVPGGLGPRYFWRLVRDRHNLDDFTGLYDSTYDSYDSLYDVYDSFYEVLAGRFLLRWWYYGSPIRAKRPTGLIPPPEDWSNFLAWAAYRGYLRRVGSQYVWLHETLRIWFGKYLDSATLAALGK